MRLRLDQLEAHLTGRLLPIYLLFGDEPQQQMEAGDAIRNHARAQGYSDRQTFHVDRSFDWATLSAASDALSLFAEQRLLELRIPTGKPGDAGAKALVAYAANPPTADLLLISCGKLDKRQQQSKWFKALEQQGAVVPIWPLSGRDLEAWLDRRLVERGVQAPAAAASLLAERVEGNLLAAAQEVDKLHLLYGSEPLSLEQIEEAVADNARYDLFELVDTALLGDQVRCVRMIGGLRQEGVEPVLVLWALLRELRALTKMAAEVVRAGSIEGVISSHRVWSNRQRPVRMALQRHSLGRWRLLLLRAGHIDRILKGAEPGNGWDELQQLLLLMAGRRIL